jgi:hypothetical protein
VQTTGLTEIIQIEKLLAEFPNEALGQILGQVGTAHEKYPIYQISIGSRNPQAPVLGLIAGVHGLERVGSQVIISLLTSLLRIQTWDEPLADLLKKIRIFAIPTLNPWGIANLRRSNAQGVDLMRNSPVREDGPLPWLLGGQDYGPWLPWYQGRELQEESKIVIQALIQQTERTNFSWMMDVHSGFGFHDQIWFPFANTAKPFPDIAEVYQFKTHFDLSHPHHFYKIEPQSYRTRGDLWDYAYHQIRTPQRFFMPLTLELGSWIWIKKNPLQLFSRQGLFHPLKPHRHRRILRRHWTLFDFMIRMTHNHEKWTKLTSIKRDQAHSEAMKFWYKRGLLAQGKIQAF